MKAAVYRSRGSIEVESHPVPKPEAGDVLVRVSHCGVCGTDLHFVMDGWGRPDSVGGHEFSGEIAALGSGVEGWQLGDAVVGGPEPGCSRCEFCRSSRPWLCDSGRRPGAAGRPGAFAEYKMVREEQLVAVPEGLSLRTAALCEPLAVALHGITRSGVKPGDRALVTGAGPIGALTIAALVALGVDDVRVSEPGAVRRELALRLGARSVVDPSALQVPLLPYELADEPVEVAFECSGKPEALRAAMAQLAKTGSLVILGTGLEQPALDCNRVILNELIVTGAYNYDANGFSRAIELLASGRLPIDDLIDARDVPLEGLLESMQGLVAGEIAGKVMVAPAAQASGGKDG
jgi:threonine dehydrogenase-like Zn-dependent dehydrogenase